MSTINTIQIKRSLTTVIPTGLEAGELAYSFAPTGNTLWIGDANNPGSAIPIGGGSYFYLNNITPGVWTPLQAVIPDANGDINDIKTNQLTLGGVSLNWANTVANLTTLGAASNNELVSSWAIKEYVDLNTNVNIVFNTDIGGAAVNPKTQTASIIGGAGIETTGAGQSITFDLEPSGVVPGTYLGFDVDLYGRVTNFNSTGLSTTLSLAGDVGTDVIDLASDVLQIKGGTGVSTSIALNTITIDADHNLLPNYVANEHIDHSAVSIIAGTGLSGGGDLTTSRTLSVVANTSNGLLADANGISVKTGLGVYLDASGNVAIGQEVFTTSNVQFNDATFTGNVFIQGTQTIVNTQTLDILDPLIRLASNNSVSDIVDIGLYGEYNSGAGQVFTGLFRDASDGLYKLFQDNPTQPTTTVSGPLNIATLVANITGSVVSNLLQPIAVPDGGTGLNNITVNGIMVGDGINPVKTVSGLPYEVFQIDSLGNPVFGMIDCGDY